MGADRDLVHIAEDVQLGQGDVGGCLALDTVAGGHDVDGAHPAGTARLGAVFTAGLPQLLGLLAEPLAGEGALAHAGGVGLHHTDDLVHLGGGQAGAHRGVGRHSVGGGGVGIDAVVQIPQGAQLGLKEDVLPLGLGLAQECAGIADKGLDLLAEVRHPGHHLVHGVGLGPVDLGEDQVLPLQNVLEVGLEMLGIEELAGHDGLFLVLVRVERSDALLGGAVLLVLETGLLQGVQIPVPGQQERSPVADLEILGGDGHALAHHVGHLRPQALAVQSHAVAQDIHHALAEDAGGQQVQGELAELVDHGVAGVAAALITDYHVIVLGDEVHHTALALVTPVDAYNGAIRHT